jgi:hypothetical protein
MVIYFIIRNFFLPYCKILINLVFIYKKNTNLYILSHVEAKLYPKYHQIAYFNVLLYYYGY